MAITAYTGLPGSGKSYSIWEYSIIPALKEGREVWTNIPFVESDVLADFDTFPCSFSIDDINANPNFFHEVLPKGALVVIDELWKLWPAGIRPNAAVPDHLEFLAEHRHLVGESGRSTEVIVATQDLAQVATFARNLVANTFRTVKLDVVGQAKRFRVDIYQGPVSGPNPPEKLRIDQRFGTYKKDVYKYYVSHTKSTTGLPGDESRSDNRFNIFSGSYFKYGAVLVVCLGLFAWYGLTSVADEYSGDKGGVVQDVSDIQTIAFNPEVGSSALQAQPQAPQYNVFDDYDAHISFNLGQGKNIDYRFSFQDGDSTFEMSAMDLVSLGYDFKGFNNCLVFVTVNRIKYAVTCEAEKDNSSVGFMGSETITL